MSTAVLLRFPVNAAPVEVTPSAPPPTDEPCLSIEAVLRDASTGALLDTMVVLTHRIHEEKAGQGHATLLASLRDQRHQIRNEIVTRAGQT